MGRQQSRDCVMRGGIGFVCVLIVLIGTATGAPVSDKFKNLLTWTVDHTQSEAKHFLSAIQSIANTTTANGALGNLKSAISNLMNPTTTATAPQNNSTAKSADGTTATKGKRCVFVHGLSFLPDVASGPSTPSFSWYWGEVEKHTAQCSEHIFTHQNTMIKSWHDPELYRETCEIVSGHSEDKVIRNTIVFTHSMGSLMLAAGIESHSCSIDHWSSTWYALGTPPPTLNNRPLTMAYLLRAAADVSEPQMEKMNVYLKGAIGVDGVGLIDQKSGSLFRSLSCLAELSTCHNMPSPETRQRVAQILHDEVSGAVCGRSGYGLGATAIMSVSEWMWTDKPSDGVVDTDACVALFGKERFDGSYESPFFVSNVNHFDLACKHGDGDAKDAKVCSWFSIRK